MSRTTVIIFGGTGDLTYRKLIPALYNLSQRELLGDDFSIIAIGRRDYDTTAYTGVIDSWLKQFARLRFDEERLAAFYRHIHYYRMDFTRQEEYEGLNAFCAGPESSATLVYYAVAPQFFNAITYGVSACPNIRSPRIILEKPFGADLEMAKLLSYALESRFGAENIYRIDHYLGKEMIRNILAIRENNPIIENAWSRESIECVHISALETVGVETRGDYYDRAGALKDMVQNHLLQLLSITALEHTGGNLADEQLAVLQCLRSAAGLDIRDSMVLGQYEGYREEPKVAPDSDTETYACLKLFIDNDRWQGVPFFIRTGKKCGSREVEVAITFRRVSPAVDPDVLIIKIQPTEGVYLEFNIKTPGEEAGISKAKMEFCQNCNDIFRRNTPEAYERMLYACITGDSSWFSKWDMIEFCWKYIEELKALYDAAGLTVCPYAQESAGPAEADRLAENGDQRWRG